MKEKDIYARMQEKLSPKMFLQRIESNTGLGIPDVAFTKDVITSGWIEVKVVNKFPKREVLKVPFRPGQFAWKTNYRKYSSRIYLFLYVENSFFIFKGDCILQIYSQDNIHMFSCYDSLWRNVNWKEVYNLL